MWAGQGFTPGGEQIDVASFVARRGEWLPNGADERYIKSLMHPVHEPGKMASWIAPPAKGINGLPNEFVYVRV
jgi:benzoyl-CoA 2,3-dioxygenase component B